jgi:mono/diheme cytochrome c family protein
MNVVSRSGLGLLVVASAALPSCSADDDTSHDAAPSAGAALYAASCATCHGADLRGTRLGPSQLSEVYEPSHHSDETYRAAIRNGAAAHHWDFGPMPAFPGLDDDQITKIIAFIRSVQRQEGFEAVPPE